jgi:hypothetical protein
MKTLLAVLSASVCFVSAQQAATPKPAEYSVYFQSWDAGEIKRCTTYAQ